MAGTTSKHKAEDTPDTSPPDAKKAKPSDETTEHAKNGSAVEPAGRDEEIPSSILEKGIIYFFFRGRVGLDDDPQEVDDIARTYMILRPIEKDAKLGDGPIGDARNSRLLALPKKSLPLSGKDRFMTFVEKTGTGFETLKEEFLSSTKYETKTKGTRVSPAATPVGEGVYAITSTGRESHLAYLLTLPAELGEVQKELGLREKASFVLSTKNPEFPSPQNARLPQDPEFSKEIKDSFGSLRWLPTRPDHLDFVNASILLIGDSSGLEKALELQEEDAKVNGTEDPIEEMEKLEDEDTKRMKNLSNSDSEAIYADLKVQAKDYPKLKTTF